MIARDHTVGRLEARNSGKTEKLGRLLESDNSKSWKIKMF